MSKLFKTRLKHSNIKFIENISTTFILLSYTATKVASKCVLEKVEQRKQEITHTHLRWRERRPVLWTGS